MATEDVDFRLTARNETKAAFEEAKKGLEGFGKSVSDARILLTTLGAAVGAQQFAAMLQGAVTASARYKDLGEIAGTTAERISGMEVPARLAGKSLEEVAGAVAKLGKSIGEARLGDQGKASLLRALGIDPDDGRDAALVMVDVAKAVMGMNDQAVAGKVASDLLGKSYAELRPFLKELADQGTLVARVTNEQAEAADRYKDDLERLSLQLDQAKLKLASDLLPVLNEIADAMQRAEKETEAFSTAMQGGVVFFQAFAVAGANVAFTFKMIGGEIGVIAAQMAAIARFESLEFIQLIGEEWTRDAAKARAELDAFELRVMSIGKTARDVKDNFDFFGKGNPLLGGAQADAEAAVRARMLFEQHYQARLTQERGFADRHAATIKIGNALAEEARKQGLISEEDLIRQTAANEEARLQVMIRSLEKQRALHAEKGDPTQIATAEQRIAAAKAELAAIQTITQARITSLQEMSTLKWQQDLAVKISRIQQESFTELEQLEGHLIDKQNVIDAAAREGLIDDEVWQAQTAMLFLQYEQKKTSIIDAETRKRLGIANIYRKLDRDSAAFFLGELSGLMNSQHRAQFEIGRAAAASMTIINAFRHAEGAAAALADIPYVGPYLAAAAYAAALAQGFEAAHRIRTTQFGDSGGGATAVYAASPVTGIAAGQPGGDVGTTSPVPGIVQAERPTVIQLNITFTGSGRYTQEEIRDSLVPALDEAFGDGVVFRNSPA
jgi:hypothetical protein